MSDAFFNSADGLSCVVYGMSGLLGKISYVQIQTSCMLGEISDLMVEISCLPE